MVSRFWNYVRQIVGMFQIYKYMQAQTLAILNNTSIQCSQQTVKVKKKNSCTMYNTWVGGFLHPYHLWLQRQ
jgi:hypothetical protein